MKMTTIGLLCCIIGVSAQSAAFQNLGFESASLVPVPNDAYNSVYFDSAFPGWTGYVGNTQETAALTNSIFLCCSGISLWNHSRPVIEGSFGAALHAEFRLDDGQPADASIAQTGLVPDEAQSLL